MDPQAPQDLNDVGVICEVQRRRMASKGNPQPQCLWWAMDIRDLRNYTLKNSEDKLEIMTSHLSG